jgi:hypothetical protein
MGDPHFPIKAEKVQGQVQAIRVAELYVMGTSKANMAKELGISTGRITTIIHSDECIAEQLRLKNAMKAQSLSRVIAYATHDLQPLALKAFKNNLEKDSMEAVKTWLKLMGGLSDKTEEVKSDTSITVILPDTNAKETIIIPKDDV